MKYSRFSHDVIVCVHNGLDDVKLCLDSIIQHWDPDVLNRLIIVNDASLPETRDYLDQFAAPFGFVDVLNLAEQNYYTKASNTGLRESTAKLKTLLNSDTIVSKNWAKKIQSVFASSEHIGIVGPLSNAASTQSVPFVKSSKTQTAINELPPGISVEEFGQFIENTARDRVIPFVPLVHGFCLTIKSDVLDDIGYFDEMSFPRGYGEENDFCFRAEDAGYILAIAIDVFIFHAKSKSYSSSDRVQFMSDGMRMLSKKHGVARIQKSVTFMEENPHLKFMREAVLNNWSSHYSFSAMGDA